MNVALRPRHLNLISLCTGGGGLDLGVGLAMPSARSVVLVEREAFAVAHLVTAMQQGLMDEAPIWSDVTTFNGRPWRGIVDGVIGGIPCQPHSLAGRRRGSDDERDLWSDARRIIVQSGAWFVLIENVPGMLSAKPGLDPGALRVRRGLQRLGFDVEGGLFTAAEVGASHERERLFILGVRDVAEGSGLDSIGSMGHASLSRGRGISIQSGRQDETSTYSNRTVSLFPPGPRDLKGWTRVLERAQELEPAFRRMADGLAPEMDFARVDRLRMLGNGVASLAAAYACRTLATRLAEAGSVAADQLVRMMSHV